MSPQLLIDGTASQRFYREAKSAAKIKHPNVVTVHSVDENRGLPYLVMEFVDGPTLEQKLSAGRLTMGAIEQISIQMVAALSAAHASDVIHRDIKPANVMLESPGDHVKITDFWFGIGSGAVKADEDRVVGRHSRVSFTGTSNGTGSGPT